MTVSHKQGDLTTLRGGADAELVEPELSVVVVHAEGAKTMPIARGGTVVVGRAHPADLVVVDGSLSRQHARVRVSSSGEVEVEDLGSTNGTFAGGKRVQRVRVAVGETVRLGDVTVLVQAGRGGPAPSGLEGYDRFILAVEQEIVRAKTFGRPAALLMVRLVPGPPGQPVATAHERFTRIAAELRPVDRMGLYAQGQIQILAPEVGPDAARNLAAMIARAVPSAKVSVATFPEDGTTVDELVAASRDGVSGSREGPVADSAAMRKVRTEIDRLAASELPVLLLGETGVGKELLARRVHDRSARKSGPFHAVSCAAVAPALLESALFGHERGAFTGAEKTTRGVFELASGGTLFLDEVGELTSAAQAALLRVLETRAIVRVGSERPLAVDVRIVAATHRDLDAMVERGEFRQDLLFRLEGAAVAIPPLRARASEIEPLARAFLDESNRANGRACVGFDEEASHAMHAYPWPGNVRELRNAVARAVVVAERDRITLADLPERVRRASAVRLPANASVPPPGLGVASGSADFRERVKNETRALEVSLIEEALRTHGGNQTAAARALNLPIRTLSHKMKELGIKKP